MGASQRTKGAVFEREVCDALAARFSTKVTRHIGQSRDGGNDITFGPLVIECKRRKALKTIEGYLRQAQLSLAIQTSPDANIPLVVMRADGGQRMAMLSLDHFLDLAGPEITRLMGLPAGAK